MGKKIGLSSKRKGKVAPPPPPPKNSTQPDLAPTSSIRDIDHELRDDADSFVGEEISVPTLGEEKVADEKTPNASIDRDAIARKEQEATSRLALLTSSIATAQKALGNIEEEAALKADFIAAAKKHEEERRITEAKFSNAATVLQAASRRMIAKKNYSAIKAQHIFASAACIQSLARGIMVRRRVKAQISSIVLAQAYARGMIIRNRKNAAEIAIVPLQAIVRGHIDRKRVKVIKWYHAKSSTPKSFVSLAPKGVDVTGDMVHLLLEASKGSERAKECAVAAKKVLIRNTSLYVSFINALLSAQIDVYGTMETVLSTSTSIDTIVDELLCFLAMLVQDNYQAFVPSFKIQCAHSIFVEKCPDLYVEVCRAMGCKSNVSIVDVYYTNSVAGDEDLKARYELTRTCYAVFFKSKPPVEFWPATSSNGNNVAREENHLSFLNEENLDDDGTGTLNELDYDDEFSFEGCTIYTNVFDMNPKAFAKELRFLAEEQGIDTKMIVDELRNVGLKVEETVGKAAASMKNKTQEEDQSEESASDAKKGDTVDHGIASAFMRFFD